MKQIAMILLAGGLLCSTAAQADSGDAYQFTIIQGQANTAQNLVRTNTASGQSILCPGSLACIAIADAKPVSAGSYRLSSWATIEGGNRAWGVTRLDVKSGRAWALAYDGKVASWSEYTGP